jgi:hypothetical protein
MSRYTDKQLEVINFLESLVFSRFTVETLEAKINNEYNSNIKLELHSELEGDDERTDFNLIGVLEFKDVFCDVDVYFLPMRCNGFDGSNIMVTEVGYEFE